MEAAPSNVYAPRPSLVHLLLDALLPSLCLGCARRLPPGRSPLLLCLPCRGRLPAPADRRCPRCLGSRCAGSCSGRARPGFDRIVAPWPYDPPLDAVLRAFKFGRLEVLGTDLATLLAPRLRAAGIEGDLVTSVPLHPLRRFRRGFDQAESIARPLAGLLGLPYRRTLRRRRWTSPQTRLGGRTRRQNLAGAFAPCSPLGGTLVLVDDVVTTGATLRAAARALAEAGARSIQAVTVAATPSRGRGSS